MPSTSRWTDALMRHRGVLEAAVWPLVFGLEAAFNTAVLRLDAEHAGRPLVAWQAATWEWSSAFAWLVLVPAIAWMVRMAPLEWGAMARNLTRHAGASIVASLAHVGLMVAAREAVYAMHGLDYAFGDWIGGFGYEYLKDVRTYALIVGAITTYRFIVLRLQGEARLLSAPDEGPAVEPVDRPERFLVRKLGKDFLLPAAEIEWLQAWGNYVNLRVRDHDYPLRTTMAAIEGRLDPARFVRVHRSYIVNIDQVERIEPTDSGEARIRMKGGGSVPCSRRYRDALRSRAGT